MSTKTGSPSVGHCKSCIKLINEANSLRLSTDRNRVPCFVTRIFHNFTFVLWAAIDLTRKKLPSVSSRTSKVVGLATLGVDYQFFGAMKPLKEWAIYAGQMGE